MKKFLLLILALVLCLGVMTSCFDSSDDDSTGDNSGSQNGGTNNDGDKAEENLQAAIDIIWANYNSTDGTEVRANFDRQSAVIVGDLKYSVVWTADSDKITIVEKSNVLVTIKLPDTIEEAFSFKLTATITDSNGNSKSKVFNYTVPVPTAEKPVEGVAYKLAMVHTNLENKVLYITGGMNGYYMDTTEDVAKAVNIYVEETEGGYYMYYKMADTGAKKYINMVVSGSYVNAKFEDKASTVYTYDEDLKTFVSTVNDEIYVHGTSSSGSYTTLGPVKKSDSPCFAAFELAANGGVGGDHSHEFTSGKCPCGAIDPTYVAPDAPAGAATLEEGKGYYIAARNSSGYVYFNGTLNSGRFNGVAGKADAVAVFVEATEGGFYLYFDAKGVKTYVVMSDSSTGGSFATDKASATVFEWDADLKTLVVADDENARAFGMDDTKTFTTFSCYAVSNTQYNWGVYIVAEGVTPPEYEEPGTPDAPECEHKYVDGVCSECGAKDPSYVAPTPALDGVKPVVGTAYKFGMLQAKAEKTLYITGAMDTYYMATTEDIAAALDVYVEETEGGYYITCTIDGAKKYINMVVSGTHVNAKFEDAASTVYTYDETLKTFKSIVNDAEYIFGTRNDNTYLTVGANKASYNPFYCVFVEAPAEGGGSATPDEPGEDEVCEHKYVDGVCSECGAKDPDYKPEEPDAPSESAVLIDGVISKAFPEGLTYITNNSSYPNPSFYGDGGLKMNYVNMGIQTAKFAVQNSVKVTISVNALNENTKSNSDAPVFTVYGLDTDGNTVATAALEEIAKGENVVELEGAGIVSVKIIMTDYAFNGSKACNISVGGVKVEGAAAGGDAPVEPDAPECEHKYVDGVCSECGAKDPSYVAPTPALDGVKPVVGTAYKFGMLQAKAEKTLYITGAMDTYYMATTEDIAAALDVYVEETEGGYYITCTIDGAKKYINMVVSGTHVNAKFEDAASTVYTYDETLKTFKSIVNDAEYIFGTRNDNTYLTVGANKASYNPFYCVFVEAPAEGGGSATPDEPGTPDAPECEHKYVDGVCSECGAKDPDYKPETPDVPAGGSADFNSIVLPSSKPNGDSSYTATYTTANGWVSTNAAIQCGGAAVLNPQFPVIGADNTFKAVCLNGKISAKGSLTSPTLNGGISKITINYTKMFTDTALSATVTITDVATGEKQTYVFEQLTLDKNEKYVVYTAEFVLDAAITGDFTIEIVNNCPSNVDGNKDRMTILSVVWEG